MTNPVDQEELALFRESVIKALETEVAPHYEAWEKSGIVPRELWNTLGDAGMLCVGVPDDCGGCGDVPDEICNGVDDDCDGAVDETYDLTSDSFNCGACGTICNETNATARGLEHQHNKQQAHPNICWPATFQA